MSLLYVVPLVLLFGGGAVWLFIWALQNGGLDPTQRRHTPEDELRAEREALDRLRYGDVPGLDIRSDRTPSQQPPPQDARRRAGGDAAE